MKLPLLPVHAFCTSWWDVDHHAYGAPLGVIVHTPRWCLQVRPFSSFAQGGDRRGELEWRRTREGPSPYEREQVAKWVLSDENPEMWGRLRDRHLCRCRFCAVCLHDEKTCRMIGHRAPARYVRHGVFARHLWLMHIRRRQRCRIRLKDTTEVEVT